MISSVAHVQRVGINLRSKFDKIMVHPILRLGTSAAPYKYKSSYNHRGVKTVIVGKTITIVGHIVDLKG